MEKGCGKFSGFVRKPVENTLGGLKNPGNMREKFSTDFLAHVENLFCGPWNVPLSRDVFPLPLGQGEHPEAEQKHPRHQQVKAPPTRLPKMPATEDTAEKNAWALAFKWAGASS